MRIGELSERTGRPRRLLRYYEEQGLLAAGLPTRIIKQIRPCLGWARRTRRTR